MKIKNIKKQKDGKYKLKFDDNSSLITYDNVILNNNLLFNANIDSEKLSKINEENSYYDIYNDCLKFAMKKVRSKKEIEDFLFKMNLESKIYDAILSDLISKGLINDHLYARSYIHDRMTLSNDGPLKIKENLLNCGIDNNIIDDEFSKIDSSIFNEKCEKIIRKKIDSNHNYSISMLKRKICNELFLLGYDVSDIDMYFNYDDDDVLKKEYTKLKKKYSLKYDGENLQNIVFQKLYAKGFDKENIKRILYF